MARCPAHDDREPSLSISEADGGKVLVRCHAQCKQTVVISALRARGLWDLADGDPEIGLSAENQRPAGAEGCGAERTKAALAIWNDAKPAAGTLVMHYLAKRGLQVSILSSLRFHPRLKHPTDGIWPGMVALVTRGGDGMPVAIHRTFLARDGSAKAPVKPAKMMLGPCRGGAVRLSAHSSVLMVGEGIETCLAAMQATGHPAWAALSTSGLRSLELPDDINDVIVLADGDEPGEAAARSCALRWSRKDRRVRIARPPRGLDFNDLLLGNGLVGKERRP
jgi:hypothetical protein